MSARPAAFKKKGGKGRPSVDAKGGKAVPRKLGAPKRPAGRPSRSATSDAPIREAAAPKAPTAAARRVQTLVVAEADAGLRLDRWFKRHMPALGVAHLNKIVRKGEVRVDGKRAEMSTRLAAGQSLRVPPLEAAAPAAAALKTFAAAPDDARALRDMTLFEDKHVLVLNKPWGLAAQGGSGMTRHVDGLLRSLAGEKGERPVLVHRLDRDTSGVLLVAKSRAIAADLGEMFRSRLTRKIYWALVLGVPKPMQGRISLFLAKGPGMGDARGPGKPGLGHAGLEKMRVARHGEADARHSVTLYAVVEKAAHQVAWLSMKPITGRTHQLRAHAEAIGHPIVGDPKYGALRSNDPRLNDPLRALPDGIDMKLHLLARRLTLPHPRGGAIDVTAPLPAHMRRSWELLGFDERAEDPIEAAPDA